MATDNHGFDDAYAVGDDFDYNDEFADLEVKVIVRDTDANKSNYTPHDTALFHATDTDAWYRGDGSGWNKLGQFVDKAKSELQAVNADLSTISGNQVGVSRAIDDGTNTPSGHAELCLWVTDPSDGTDKWQIVGTETYIEVS